MKPEPVNRAKLEYISTDNALGLFSSPSTNCNVLSRAYALLGETTRLSGTSSNNGTYRADKSIMGVHRKEYVMSWKKT